MTVVATVFLTLLSAYVLAVMLHVIGMALVAYLLNVPMCLVQFGFGTLLGSYRAGETRIGLTPYLLGGFVKFYSDDDDDEDEVVDCHKSSMSNPNLAMFSERSPGSRGAIILGGIGALVLPAVAVLGTEAITAIRVSWEQFISAFGLGSYDSHALLTEINQLVLMEPWSIVVALTFTKVAGFNLLPLSILNGGSLLILAYEAVVGTPLPKRILEQSFKVSLLVVLATLGAWLFTFVTWMLSWEKFGAVPGWFHKDWAPIMAYGLVTVAITYARYFS